MRRSIPLVLAAAVLVLAAPGAQATYPGDNGLIVFHLETDTGFQLFTMRPDGTEVTQITHVEPEAGRDHPGASLPDWSPDGRTIVFDDNSCGFAIVNADGSDLREVPFEPGRTPMVDQCETDASFTPDGRSLVYERWDFKDGLDEIWSVGIDGTDRHLVTDACNIDPNVSPDGTRLSCRAGDAPGTLTIVNMDGSGAMPVAQPSGISSKNDWAPDGSAIVFSDEYREGSPAIANVLTIAPDGTDPHYLTDVVADSGANQTSYSPDGTSIIYREHRGDRVRGLRHARRRQRRSPDHRVLGLRPRAPGLGCGAGSV